MKHLLPLFLLPLLLTFSATAETIPLVKAAELTTKFLAEIKVAEKPLSEFFVVTSLVRRPPPEKPDPAAVEWLVFLAETKHDRAGEDTRLAFRENGQEFRRVIEIRGDGSIALGKVRGGQPRPRVVPPPKE